MQTVRTLALALLLAVLPLVAAAEPPPEPDSDPYSREGWYVSIGAYYQKEYAQNTCEGGLTPELTCANGFQPDSAAGVASHGGYRFHRYAAAEVQFEWVKDALEDDFNEHAFVTTVNLKGYLPLRRLQPFALVGFGWMRAPVPLQMQRAVRVENGIAFRFGGGFELYATKHWALLGEVSWVQPLPINHLERVPYLSLGGGVQYRF